jgi:hypothetical protein
LLFTEASIEISANTNMKAISCELADMINMIDDLIKVALHSFWS